MKHLSAVEVREVREFMENKGFSKGTIDTYMTSIRKASEFFELSVLEQIRLAHRQNGLDYKELGDYIYNIYTKRTENLMSEKQANNFKSHLRLAASFVLLEELVTAD